MRTHNEHKCTFSWKLPLFQIMHQPRECNLSKIIISIEGVCTCALQQVKPKTESHLLDLYSCERPKICCFYHWIDKMYWTCQNYSCLLYSHHFQAGLQDIDFTCCFNCFPKLCVYVWIYLFRNYQHTLNFLWSDSFAYGLFFAPK